MASILLIGSNEVLWYAKHWRTNPRKEKLSKNNNTKASNTLNNIGQL